MRAEALAPSHETPSPQTGIMAVDSTSVESIRSMGIPRVGILFGAIEVNYGTVDVDAIYECSQDPVTSQFLHDSRLQMIIRVSKLMGLKPVGILVNTLTVPKASELIYLSHIEDAITYTMLSIGTDNLQAVRLTPKCLEYIRSGELTASTTLTGPTVNGGLNWDILHEKMVVLPRKVNEVIHTGFYRLNRSNHTPTMDDVRVFIQARKEKAHIGERYLQLADYHLILFIAESLGESTAERVILAIFQEDEELVEGLVEMLESEYV